MKGLTKEHILFAYFCVFWEITEISSNTETQGISACLTAYLQKVKSCLKIYLLVPNDPLHA